MRPRFFTLIALITLGLALPVMILMATPQQNASAQCGSQASSCRNCHEVQKAATVNAKGEWHIAHAFGDFCEFCHAGNAQSKDKVAAHAGMLDPLADVKGSCQSCHPSDYMDRAKKYTDALGKPIGSGPVTDALTTTSAGSTTPAGDAPCGSAAPAGGQIIDLNKVYAGLDQARPNTLGNAILIALIIAVALVLAGLVFHYEHPLPRAIAAFRQLLATPTGESPERVSLSPEMETLLPLLSSSDPTTVRAVTQLLSDRENGPRVLKALSHLDLRALAELGERDQKALASLMTLAKEMR
jgi:hypothetical protein